MDRFIAGWISGLVGGIMMNLWEFISFHLLGFSQHRFVDWTSIAMYGRLPQNAFEVILALVFHILFTGFLGGIFALVLSYIGSEYPVMKGVIYATILTFAFFAVPTFLQHPILSQTPAVTVVSNHIGAIIWGVSMARTLHRLKPRQLQP